jgi:hypothetical protein
MSPMHSLLSMLRQPFFSMGTTVADLLLRAICFSDACTFSVNCIYNAENVAGIRYAYAQGHQVMRRQPYLILLWFLITPPQVASHTWRHARLTELNVATITDEMYVYVSLTYPFVPPFNATQGPGRRSAPAHRGRHPRLHATSIRSLQ